MTHIDISIISDTVCPWCYIGSRRLQKAISLYQKTYPGGSKDVFDITWKPYYCDPSAPNEGVLIHERMVSRMGQERAVKSQQHLQGLGTGEGIMFKFGGKTGNSRLSHQLMQLAKTKSSEIQWNVAEELFRLHFEEERAITDLQTLVDAGSACGLEEDEIRTWLQEEKGAQMVDKEVEEVKNMGVNGVPQFLLHGRKHQIDGAADVMDFLETIIKVKESADEGDDIEGERARPEGPNQGLSPLIQGRRCG